MRAKAVFLSLAIVGAILGSASGTQAKPAQQGAFLTEYAGSVDSIFQQVEANRLVALRYAKHFKMDPASVLVYFRSELSMATLDNSASMKVYFIGDSSRIEDESREFNKGTKVFVDSQGVPILEFGTGNPLGTSLEPAKPPEKIINANNPQAGQQAGSTVSQATPVTQPQDALTAPVPGTTQPVVTPTGDVTPPVVTPAPSPAVVASAPPGDNGPILPKIGHSRSSNWMVPLGLAGALAALAAGSGSSGSSGNPGDGRTDGGPLPLVPEPVSLTMMSMGIATLGGMVWRRRRAR